MIACACTGCGRLEVLADAELERRAAAGDGHHAVPDDPEADWICYGKPEPIEDEKRRTEVEQAHAARSVHGVAELQPSKLELARRRESVDGHRRQERHAADLACEDARLREEFTKEAP